MINLTKQEVIDALMAELELRRSGRKIDKFFNTPELRKGYVKQMEFFKAGVDHKIRLFLAGNRIGKTVTGCYELSCHLTGQYPDWWEGRRYKHPINVWALSPTLKSSVGILQSELLGPIDNIGSGMLPRECIDFETLKDVKKQGGSVGSMRIKSIDGNYSTLEFISAEQGRSALQGTERSIYVDEEVSEAIWVELLTRAMTATSHGEENFVMATFTPLSGLTDVVRSFLEEDDLLTQGTVGNIEDSKHVTRATWDDVPHLSESAKAVLLASYPPHQRDARSKGIPQLGSGAIYPVSESSFIIDPIEVPSHWAKAGGFDVGRNTAAAWGAYDRESDVFYIYSDMLMVEGTIADHVESLKARGDWIQLAIDSASHGRSQTDGQNLFKMYSDAGLNITNADKAVEAGIQDVLTLLTSGRLKIFSTCTNIIKEIRMYRRDEKGKIVKKDDHVMDALRYLVHTRKKVLRTHAEYNAIHAPKLPNNSGGGGGRGNAWMP